MKNNSGLDSVQTQSRPKSIFVVGPTASGKSELAMMIAEKYDGEIVCADSQTIRKDLNIGTAKPSRQDQEKIRHHMLDLIKPYDKFTVAEFKKMAEEIIADIKSRNKIPVIVGGTGLYIYSLLYNYEFRKNKSKYNRDELDKKSVDELKEIIKSGQLELPENEENPRHLIRVIESLGEESKKSEKAKDSIVVGIDPGKEMLDKRIEARVGKMINNGFLEEVESVVEKYGVPDHEIDAIGYKIALNNRLSKNKYDAVKIIDEFIRADKKYAKRQRIWYKNNPDIMWFQGVEEGFEYIKSTISK